MRQPEVVPFDVERICAHEFKIVLPSIETLYESFGALKKCVER